MGGGGKKGREKREKGRERREKEGRGGGERGGGGPCGWRTNKTDLVNKRFVPAKKKKKKLKKLKMKINE